jgi:hypothetical protein
MTNITNNGNIGQWHDWGPGRMGGNTLGKIIEGALIQVAKDIVGQFFNNLGCGQHAFPKLPPFFDIRCGTMPQPGIWKGGCVMPPPRGPICIPEPKAQWTAQMTGTNTAKVNLGDGYKLEIDERNSQMTIFNEKTGERTKIWGDPHVEVDGKHAFDFWGTTTFTLENGTKITVNTEQWNGNPNAYVASQVVITKGDNAMTIDGISQNKLGDLSVTMGQNGYALDAAHRDGYTLHENENGSGWNTETGKRATQEDLNATAIGREYGPGSELPSLGEMGEALGKFLLFGIVLGGFGGFTNFGNTGGFDNGGSNDGFRERPRERFNDRSDFFRHTQIP